MNEKRKTIKITIPSGDVDKFMEAKSEAENALMIRLSDTQFASRLIQWAINQKEAK